MAALSASQSLSPVQSGSAASMAPSRSTMRSKQGRRALSPSRHSQTSWEKSPGHSGGSCSPSLRTTLEWMICGARKAGALDAGARARRRRLDVQRPPRTPAAGGSPPTRGGCSTSRRPGRQSCGQGSRGRRAELWWGHRSASAGAPRPGCQQGGHLLPSRPLSPNLYTSVALESTSASSSSGGMWLQAGAHQSTGPVDERRWIPPAATAGRPPLAFSPPDRAIAAGLALCAAQHSGQPKIRHLRSSGAGASQKPL